MINSRDIKDVMTMIRPWKHNIRDDEYYRGWNDCIKQLRDNEKSLIRTIESIEKQYVGDITRDRGVTDHVNDLGSGKKQS